MENRNGPAVNCCVTAADGHAEPQAAAAMVEEIPGQPRVTPGADKGYDHKDFVRELRDHQVTPHIARKQTMIIDDRTTRHSGYAISQQKRKRVEEIFGWLNGRFVFRQERDKFNGATFFVFLRELRRTSIRSGPRVVVIADNGRYHHSALHKLWRAQQAPGFVMDFLPPYSPELDPIERVWKLTRRLCLHNRYFTNSRKSSWRLKLSLATGPNAPKRSVDYAQLFQTLCNSSEREANLTHYPAFSAP